MIFRKYQWSILFRLLVLPVTIAAGMYLFVTGQYIYLALVAAVLVYQVTEMYRFHLKIHAELDQFVESIHYRDFSRNFDVAHAPAEVKSLRKGFNEINSTFKLISREKETQYQYLQKILELVDTGILSFETGTGEIVWLNESLKRMLKIPYLKTVHSLEKRDGELYREISGIKPGEHKIVNALAEKTQFKALLSATAFQTDGRKYMLVAFQNISDAIEETEAKAWQRLLNVMTHEIMNSVAPISSLANTLDHLLGDLDDKDQRSTIDDIKLGINTIKKRSEGLLKFTETYRNLNKIKTLNLKTVRVNDLFENLSMLMQPTLMQKHIGLEVILREPDLSFEADINLVEQVLINLIVNAIDALREQPQPRIAMNAFSSEDRKVVIRVADNGQGIQPELLDKIFIPFFSSRKNGSGIGLSLCKQIMMLHKGNIRVHSVAGQGTSFSLHFSAAIPLPPAEI